jgi:hypothetical protein
MKEASINATIAATLAGAWNLPDGTPLAVKQPRFHGICKELGDTGDAHRHHPQSLHAQRRHPDVWRLRHLQRARRWT